jgi:hypothetical protein
MIYEVALPVVTEADILIDCTNATREGNNKVMADGN